MSVLSSLSLNLSLIDTCQALIRDGYRCVMTGRYDDYCATEIQELDDLILSDPSLRTERTQCAHIFAESTDKSIEPGSAKVRPPVYFFFLTLDNEYPYIAGLCCHDVGDYASLWS